MKFGIWKWSLLILTSAAAMSACTKDTSEDDELVGNWKKISDFEGVARGEAISTVLNDKVYAGLGFDGTNRLTDFWVYDADLDFWKRKADFPGTPRNSAVSFAANNKVYVGLGYDGVNRLKDFWEYNPDTDSWKQVADFGGSARYGARAFAIADKGYVVAGFDGNNLKDFWMYDPTSNTWTQQVSPGGSKRIDPVVFVIDNKAYLACGSNNGINVDDCWMYDPSTGKWTEKRRMANISDEEYDDDYNIVRYQAVAFVVNNKAYVTTGINTTYLNTTWEYDASTDVWTQKTAFEGTAREGAIAFSVKGKGIVGLGRSTTLRFDDMRQFLPTEEANEDD